MRSTQRTVINPICFVSFLVLAAGVFLSACNTSPASSTDSEGDRLLLVASTTFIGDVVGNIAGEGVDLVVLLEPGQNPHSYSLTPQDMVKITEADIVFVNGFGLEEFLDNMVGGGSVSDKIVVVSDGISGLVGDSDHDHDTNIDPHVWFDPGNISIWVDNITTTLMQMDPGMADQYQANADSYLSELSDLDEWIEIELNQIPSVNRKLVSDHISLGYFARAYGFEEIGAVIPASTTEAETSGLHLAELIESIPKHQVKAIFIGRDFDPSLAEQVADEAGIELVKLYFGSLTDGPPAGTYLEYMRQNVSLITAALKE